MAVSTYPDLTLLYECCTLPSVRPSTDIKEDAMQPTFYAITGLGWGKGDTPIEAVETYLRIQRTNFPHLTDDEITEVWGFVWQAPEDATGFSLDSRLWWQTDAGPREADASERVLPIGVLPDVVFQAWRESGVSA
jgi:hypothetical protein